MPFLNETAGSEGQISILPNGGAGACPGVVILAASAGRKAIPKHGICSGLWQSGR